MTDDEATRRESASIADEYLRKRGPSLDYNTNPQGHSGEKPLAYGYSPADVPFGLSQVRAANPRPLMISDYSDTSNPPPGPSQFHTLGMAAPELASYAPAPLSQQAPPMAHHTQGFDPNAHPQMFLDQPPHPQFGLPQQMDILMNYGDPYIKPDPQQSQPNYNLPYSEYR